MADSMKLVMTFTCTDGKEHDFSWKYADESPRAADVRTLASTIITNGSIFADVPSEITAAKVVVTTESEIDIRP